MVDGRNPAPPGMYDSWYINGIDIIDYLSTGAGFQPSTVPKTAKKSK